jgi:MFS family permease
MIAVTVITVRGVLTVVSAPLWGFLAEKFAPRWLLMAMFSLYAFGILVLMQATSLAVLGIAVAIYSVALAATGIVIEVAWASYYGRHSLGAIRGFAMPGTVFLSALGPLAAGILYTTTGSYAAAFWGIIGTAAISAVSMLLCTPPRRRSGSSPP